MNIHKGWRSGVGVALSFLLAGCSGSLGTSLPATHTRAPQISEAAPDCNADGYQSTNPFGSCYASAGGGGGRL
jgi:hypothetical protein